jgi:hypothetical protein
MAFVGSMHFTKVASDIRRFGVTLGLVSISLAFLMTSAAMNLAAGILVFVAAVIPIIARLWRSASQKGRHRSFLAITAAITALLFLLAADIGWIYGMNPVLVVLFILLNGSFIVVGFLVDDVPMGRHQIAGFAISLSATFIMLAVISASVISKQTVDKSQADIWREFASALRATPTPTPH